MICALFRDVEGGRRAFLHAVGAVVHRGRILPAKRICGIFVMELSQELSEPVSAFSYPVGRQDAFNAATRTALTHNGIDWAFSYYGGFLRSPTRNPIDRLNIPRVAVESNTTIADFRSYTALPQIFSRH